MKADSTIQKELRRLNRVMEGEPHTKRARIAYLMHEVIRWAREDTRNWPAPSSEIDNYIHDIVTAQESP